MTPALPELDFALWASDTSKPEFARALDTACRTDGFFYLANHGIDPALTQATFDAAAYFFARPEAEKADIAIDKSPCHRGWFRIGQEVLNPHTAPDGDYKEGIKIGQECDADHPHMRAKLPLHGRNQWPELPDFPNWQETMQSYYDACLSVSRQLMQAFAEGLGAPRDFFDAWLITPMATLGALRYPPRRAAREGAGAHTDFGCLTLLAQDDQSGLEVEHPSQGWISVPPRAGCLVVNIGDMMARWSNDRYRSTRHRVVSPPESPRFSLPFFLTPTRLPTSPPCPIALPRAQSLPIHPRLVFRIYWKK